MYSYSRLFRIHATAPFLGQSPICFHRNRPKTFLPCQGGKENKSQVDPTCAASPLSLTGGPRINTLTDVWAPQKPSTILLLLPILESKKNTTANQPNKSRAHAYTSQAAQTLHNLRIPTESREREIQGEDEEEEKEASRMFRNQYDTDVTTWSPAGRLFQVEYAMEAVKQGSACVGLRSRTHAVLAAANKAASELSSHQRKVFRVADHAGVALAGLTADGRVLSRFLRSECINHAFVYDAPLPVSRLALRLADKAQVRLGSQSPPLSLFSPLSPT